MTNEVFLDSIGPQFCWVTSYLYKKDKAQHKEKNNLLSKWSSFLEPRSISTSPQNCTLAVLEPASHFYKFRSTYPMV